MTDRPPLWVKYGLYIAPGAPYTSEAAKGHRIVVNYLEAHPDLVSRWPFVAGGVGYFDVLKMAEYEEREGQPFPLAEWIKKRDRWWKELKSYSE